MSQSLKCHNPINKSIGKWLIDCSVSTIFNSIVTLIITGHICGMYILHRPGIRLQAAWVTLMGQSGCWPASTTYALLILVLLATALPLFTEEWLEEEHPWHLDGRFCPSVHQWWFCTWYVYNYYIIISNIGLNIIHSWMIFLPVFFSHYFMFCWRLALPARNHRSLKIAVKRLLKRVFTLSFLMHLGPE